MGYSSWSNDAYRTLRTSYTSKSTDDIFIQNKKRNMSSQMDPNGLTVRESRDSEQHPNSLAIMFFLDETGSMRRIPETIAREKLGQLMETLISKGIHDAHVLFAGLGDQFSDRCPVQVGQFEAGTEELTKWLTEIYLEGNGGGDWHESYLYAWLIAARHTAIDCFEKRNQKGFLFTVGDEASHSSIPADKLKEIMGYDEASDVTDQQLLNEAKEKYHVFHIHVQEGSYPNDTKILNYWRNLLGENLIVLENHNDICNVIADKISQTLNN